MSKFCGNCGAQLDDNALVCGYCGAPLPQQKPAKEKVSLNGILDSIKKIDFKNLDPKKVLPIAGGAVVVLILIISLIVGSGYKATIRKYVNAIEHGNEKKVIALTSKYHKQDDDFKEEVEEYLPEVVDEFEERYGDDFKIKCKIKDVDKVDRDDLKDLKERYEDEDVKAIVSKAYEVEVEITIKGSEDEDTEEDTLYLVKENGSWKVLEGWWL